jgi:glutamine synthetase
VILAAMLEGIDKKIKPPPALTGNAYQAKAQRLPSRWDEALALFEDSAFIGRAFGKDFKRVFAACKQQELALIDADISSVEHDAYLRNA